MRKKSFVTLVTALGCAACLALAAGVAGASGTAPTTTTTTATSITATTANIEGTITPNGSAITAASFCYSTSSTLASCTTASLASSVYSGLSTSSATDPVYASISGLTPNTTYYYSLSATNANGAGSSGTPYGTFTTQATGAFSCTPAFYQVSGTGSGGLYSYNIASNSFTRIGSGAVASINGLGYDTADNYLYGVSGSTLYQINNDGQFTSLGAVSNLTDSTGAAFYDGQLLETGSSGLGFQSVNVSTKTESPFTLTDHAVGSIPGASSYTAYDLTIHGSDGYGLTTGTTGSTLYVVDLANHYLASIPVTGLPDATSGTYAYGAAYSDADGNAYFYNNTTNIMYEISSSALQAAITNGTDPAAVAIGSGASSPALSGPNDGATCSDAASPYAPSVNPPTTGTVGTTTATVKGVVSPDDATLSAVDFCYSTGDDVAAAGGALTDSPTCAPVDDSVYPYQTWTGANLYNVAANLTGLSGCTTYYYQSEAVNNDGTAYSSVANFTTSGCQTVSFTSNAPSHAAVGDSYTPTGSASSGLTPVITVDSASSGVCSLASGAVSFTGTGTCVLDLNQAGNSNYAAAPQVQQTITVNAASQTGTTTTTSTTPVVDAPVNQIAPTISGTPALGAVLEASVGGWTGTDLTYRYQWLRDGVAVPGAASATFLVTTADSGHQLSVQVVASDGTSSVTAVSATVLALKVDSRGCTAPSGRLTASAIGSIKLGMTRAAARRQVASTQSLNRYTDNLCLAGGYGIRVGYGNATMLGRGKLLRSLSSRIVFAVTANPYYSLGGVRPGMTVASVTQRLHLTRPIHIGPNTWYVIPGTRTNHVLKVRHGVIQEIGDLNRALTLTRDRQGRLLRLF